LLLAREKQAAFINVSPTIWTQDLKRRQQLDSSMRLTFFQELLLRKASRIRLAFFVSRSVESLLSQTIWK
jgi:hypothetical protein